MKNERIQGILERMYAEELNPLQAAQEIDRTVGGLTGVRFGAGMSIRGNTPNAISVDRAGLRRKESERLAEAAAIMYFLAQQNGSMFPGEVHLDRGISSKHYAQGFRAYTQSVISRYAPGGQTR